MMVRHIEEEFEALSLIPLIYELTGLSFSQRRAKSPQIREVNLYLKRRNKQVRTSNIEYDRSNKVKYEVYKIDKTAY